MDKKNLTIILLAILIGASGIANIILSGEVSTSKPDEPRTAVIAASYPGLAKNDPVDTWDQASMWHQQQVTEGLVYYDISKHPNYALVPRLAESWVWNNQTSITFQIREGVVFHDGTPLTASAVKWNFERLMWFSNISGLVPANNTSKIGFSSSLYYLSNSTYIFDSFFADDVNMEFTIILNVPFGPLLDLLCFISTNIISPASHKFYEIVQRDEILVGTGPYKMDSYSFLKDIKYSRNRRWWGPAQYFDMLIMKFIDDDEERMKNGLAGHYDYITDMTDTYMDIYKKDPNLNIEEIGEDLDYFYLEFDCGSGDPDLGNPWNFQMVNSTWRRALALSINYTYIWNDIKNKEVYPGCPIVPRLMPGYNSSLDGKMVHNYPFDGTYEGNVKKAREIMQSMGFGYDGANKTDPWNTTYPGTDEAKWKYANFRNLDASYKYFEGDFSESSIHPVELSILLDVNFNLIGVDFYAVEFDSGFNLQKNQYGGYEYYYDWCDIWSARWGPDYLDAYSMFSYLLNNESDSCFSGISDPLLKTSLENASITTNNDIRRNNYQWIQSYIFDITMPENPSTYCHIPLYTYKAYQVHKTNLKGVRYNVLNILDTWNWYHEG
ncbi:MAG: ABC transporter substrate-binding protein [Candidatus Hermodarchaeota archaeon]